MERLTELPTSPSSRLPMHASRSQTSLGMVGSMSFGSSPTSKTLKEPQDTSTAMNFLPRLLGRLAAIDEKLSVLEVTKVDCKTHQQQMEALTTQTNNMAEQIRFLLGAVDELQTQMREVRFALDAKADQAAMERAQRSLHEMDRMINDKASLTFAKQLEANCMSMDTSINTLQKQLDAARQEAATHLSDEVAKIHCSLDGKSNASDTRQLFQDASSLRTSLEKARQDIAAHDNWLIEARSKIASLSGHIEDLRSRSRQLEKCKPDVHMVPLLHSDLMDRL